MRFFRTIPEYLKAIGINNIQVENFFIFKIEDYFGNGSFEMGPYKHDFFEVTFGKGHDVDIVVGDKSFKPIERILSFTTPHNISSWKINSFQENSLGYMIFFRPSLLNQHFLNIDLYKQFQFFNINTTPAISLSEVDAKELVNLMAKMLEEFKMGISQSTKNILSAYLTIILEKTNRLYTKPNAAIIFKNRAEEIAFQFEVLLKEKANYQLHLSDYASMLNISTNYLSESVKKVTGKSAKTIAQEFLTIYAKALLTQNKETVAVISEKLGFFDTSNFVKFFKKRTDLTPARFRKLNP